MKTKQNKSSKKFTTISGYISLFPKDVKAKLETIRKMVKKLVPQAEEKISYQIPSFKLNGAYLIYFAGWKEHISLYPISGNLPLLKKDLVGYRTSKGTVQFPLDKPLPLALIRKIILYRVRENGKKVVK
jgi:uncharacterized protein YdhG (YjbR/CyaY superfamily)